MKKSFLFVSAIIFFISCKPFDPKAFDEMDKRIYADGAATIADLKKLSLCFDSVLKLDPDKNLFVIPDSVKEDVGLNIYCIEDHLLQLIRDSQMNPDSNIFSDPSIYTSRDTFAWISHPVFSTGISCAFKNDSVCVKGMNDLNENYRHTGLPWILIVEPMHVEFPYLSGADNFMYGIFDANCYIVDYKKMRVVDKFAVTASNSDEVKYDNKGLFKDDPTKKIIEDFKSNCKKKLSETLREKTGISSMFKFTLYGLEDPDFFTDMRRQQTVIHGMEKYVRDSSQVKDTVKEKAEVKK